MVLVGEELAAPVDLVDPLRGRLGTTPDEVAVVSAVERLTWAELEGAAADLAAGYLELGLRPGDRVASLVPNRALLVVHYLACFRAGLVVTPLNYRYTAREIDHALAVSEASLLVAHPERDADVGASSRVPDLPLGVVLTGPGEATRPGPTLAEVSRGGARGRALPSPGPDDPAAIFFTSGSTGPAKGVTHSVASLGWMAASAAAAFALDADDRFLPASSMSHLGSFLWTIASLGVGAPVVVARTFDAGEVLGLLRAHRPTVMAMIPAALTALVRDHGATQADFSSLRLCRSGSDKVSLVLDEEFSALTGFPIDEGYGMTEVGLATLNPPTGPIRAGSIGTANPGFEVRLRPADGSAAGEAAEVPVGDVGRIWMRTPSLMQGYWDDPDATRSVVHDGWIDSGDLARADDDGYLWFFGRSKQVIVHDGSNISPFEVEEALAEHPGVALVGVVGVHDAVHGENVRAYVTRTAAGTDLVAQDLVEFARARVGYKAPEEVVFLEEMPVNPTGKLDRVGLKRLAESHLGLEERS